MEDLIALSNLLSKQKVKQINIVTENSGFHGKSRKLFKAISEGKISTDNEAVELLGYQNNKSSAYLKLKQRLLQRLINTVFFIDVNEYSKSAYEKAIHRSYRNWAAGKLILDRLKRNTAISIYESVLTTALKYDVSELILLISKDLRRHYSVYEYDKTKQAYYNDLVKKSIEHFEQEIHVEGVYSSLAQHIIKVKTPKVSTISEEYEKDIDKIIDDTKTNSRYYYNYYAYNAIYFYYFLLNDNEALEFYSKKAMAFFRKKKGFSPLAIFSFSQKLGVAYLHTNQLNKAKETFINTLKTKPKPGSLAWFSVYNYLFIVNIVLKNYQEAYDILLTTTSHPGYKKLNVRFKEPWLIKEAYIQFLIRMGKIESPVDHEKSLRPFRIGRFLNEVPVYSKDKRGLNIAILIVQMLFLILDRKYGKVIDRIDALKQYSYRYLRKNDTYRANCFIKMLLKVPEADYHPLRVKRYTKDLHKKLLETSVNVSEQSPENEIIPYENLWEIVIELLEKN